MTGGGGEGGEGMGELETSLSRVKERSVSVTDLLVCVKVFF